MSQVAQHSAATVQEFVEVSVRLRHEGLLAVGMRLAVVVGGRGAERGRAASGSGVGGGRGVWRPGRAAGGLGGVRVRIFGRGGVVWTATEELCPGLGCLLEKRS